MFKGTLSDLRQILTIESPLNMTNTSKSPFVLKFYDVTT